MMLALALCLFIASYSFTIVTTSVGYHRGLAHGAVRIREPFRKMLVVSGIWLTAIDPKGWVVMHRLHHAHSDTPNDPHSPRRLGPFGFFKMFREQLVAYDAILDALRAGDERYASIGRDVELSWVSRTNRPWLPVLVHVVVALIVVVATGSWLVGGALFAGMMSHVVQGAIINYFGHAHGGRNFAMADDSRNNHLAAWLVLGEGFQNNHHRYPSSARFSYRRREVDLGWAVSLVLEKVGVLEIQRRTVMPRARDVMTAPLSPAAHAPSSTS